MEFFPLQEKLILRSISSDDSFSRKQKDLLFFRDLKIG